MKYVAQSVKRQESRKADLRTTDGNYTLSCNTAKGEASSSHITSCDTKRIEAARRLDQRREARYHNSRIDRMIFQTVWTRREFDKSHPRMQYDLGLDVQDAMTCEQTNAWAIV